MTQLRLVAVLTLVGLTAVFARAPGGASAEGEKPIEWHLEQPEPPPPPPGVPKEEQPHPIGLGKIGDIQFYSPNRGLLITAGNPPTIPPGVWFFNGVSWRELSSVCGGSDGRIAWAGPDEFWTVSDGRPGQAPSEAGKPAPLADNTLCRFAAPAGRMEVVSSYASLAFRPDSYQAMHGAGCINASDCWFAGESLPEGQRGAFHLHWNGQTLSAEPNPEGHAVEDMRAFGGRLYESVRLSPQDLVSPEEESRFFAKEPSTLHIINPIGAPSVFVFPRIGVPEYATEELPEALDFLHLSADEGTLWGAANPAPPVKGGSEVTIVRDSEGRWRQLIGATGEPGKNPFTKFNEEEIKHEEEISHESVKAKQNEVVNSIAAEPGSESAWLALSSGRNSSLGPVAPAMLARISSEGTVTERQTLPASGEVNEGVGPKGAADKVACPALNECWMATTQGWLFHRSQGGLPEVSDPALPPVGQPITFRPPDLGLPPIVPDNPPADDSGERPATSAEPPAEPAPPAPRVTLPLLSHMHTRLINGTTLELRFHLAVKARIRLLARRRHAVVASTPTLRLAAGNRRLLLRLDRRRWPTKLDLQAHPLVPLPTIAEHAGTGETVSTRLFVLPRLLASLAGSVPAL